VSTIFIATPLLSSFLEKDPEYAGRRGDVFPEKQRARIIREAELAAAEAAPQPGPIEQVEEEIEHLEEKVGVGGDGESDEAKRARRRQRRQSRPHGRPR
jgi:hypothetical protein